MAHHGLYGARIEGIDGGDGLGEVPADYPRWTVTVSGAPSEDFLEGASWGFRLGDGGLARAEQDGTGGRLHLALSRPVAERDLGHPFLSIVGVLGPLWAGGVALHGGVFLSHGRAWVVMGGKEGGKSTTLALLARAGHRVMADDLAVVAPNLMVHRGPRFVDLRQEASESLGVGEPIGMLGTRERWRYRLGEAPLAAPLGGLILPRWGDEEGVGTLDAVSRLRLVASSFPVAYPNDRSALVMDIANGVPTLVWTRPQGLDGAAGAVERMLAELPAG
jgi:hypothetical protein